MGLLDSIIGSVLGGSSSAPQNTSGLQSILGSLLASSGGLPGLVQKFNQAGMGNVVNSWVGSGPNQQVSPGSLGQVLGQDQVDKWSQQTGMSHDTILSQLSQVLPHAVDRATPDGQMPAPGTSPFDEPGLELPSR